MRLSGAYLAFAAVALACSGAARAESNSQLHARIGMFQATYHGTSAASTGSISCANSVDIDYETFYQRRQSFFIRGNFTQDISSNQMLYSYVGAGLRHYFWGDGLPIDETNGTDHFMMVPKSRLFVGADFGLSYVLLRVFQGTPIGTQSSLIEGGGHIGYIRQVSKNIGIELLAGASMGMGFSTVSVNALMTRGLVGMTYHFD